MAKMMMKHGAPVKGVGMGAGVGLRPKRSAVVARAERQMWYPGAQAPSYLDGSMDGDYGFDPLRLGQNEGLIKYYREAELMNGRYAMLGCAGILFTELAGVGGNWWEASNSDYGLSLDKLIAIQVVVMGAFEYSRTKIYQETGECGVLSAAPFDPAKQKSPEMKVKELKNARLAMVSFLGFCSQAAVLGKGPIACLKDHIADPYHNNIYTSKVGGEATVAVMAACFAPMIIYAFKAVGKGDDDEFRPLPF
mmetsp:Transcript_12549/g.31853  ORF Transcript_12549/g.31853 Transcript_12549/m.31853 type:complete len:250 (+) Transcript_12549:202-951(+)